MEEESNSTSKQEHQSGDGKKPKSKHKHRKRSKDKEAKSKHDEDKGKHNEYKRKPKRRSSHKYEANIENRPSESDEKENIRQVRSSVLSEEDNSEYEFKRKVSWKSNIETSKEFQSSVMEQNVFVSLEDPDREYKSKATGERSYRKEKGGYTWDKNSLGSNINFTSSRPHVVQRAVAKQSTDGARGSTGFTTGRHTFRFKFNNKPWGSNCSIGICTKSANMHCAGYHHIFGCDENSWAWDIPSGCLLHGGTSKQHYVTTIEEKSIYMTLDMDKGNLYFQPKGRERFLAFKGLKDVKEEIFPCVSLVYGLSEVKISLKNTSSDNTVTGEVDEAELQTEDIKNDVTVIELHKELIKEPPLSNNGNEENKKVAENDVETEPENNTLLENKNSDDSSVNEKNKKAQSQQVVSSNDNDLNRKVDKEMGRYDQKSLIVAPVSQNQLDDQTVVHKSDKLNKDSDKESKDKEQKEQESEKETDEDTGIKKDILYKKPSTMSWFNKDEWESMDMYIVQNGNIQKETVTERELSDVLTRTNTTISVLTGDEDPDQISWDGFIPCAPIYKSPPKTLLSDEEEPEDATYTHVSTLENYEAYSLQMYHGWDLSNKGGGLQLYPSLPFICMPSPNFDGRIQGVRGRKPCKGGIHKWCIKELKLFSPKVSPNDMNNTCNKLLVGVATKEQRTFNFGYSIKSIGPDALLYEIETGLHWHGNDKKANFTHTAASGSTDSEPPSIDVSRGLEMTLNFYKHKLIISYDNRILTEIKNIGAKELYPFVVFYKEGHFPVEIKYLEGPEEYVTESLEALDKMKRSEKEDLETFKALTRQLSSKSSMMVIEDNLIKVYDWGIATKGLKLSGGSLKFSEKGAEAGRHFIAIAEIPVTGQRHKIDFHTNHMQHFIFGLVSETFDTSEIQDDRGILNTDTVSLLGSNIHSWAWDPKTLSLYHGGRYLGKYPSGTVDFEMEKFDCLRLIIDFGANGYNIASFRAIFSETGENIDLGIAFVNFPSKVYPSVALVTGWENEKLLMNMNYVAGPKGFVTNIVQSKSCTIL